MTVEFHDRGGSTEIVLTHELFLTEKARQEHEGSWVSSFDKLARIL